MLNFPDEPSDDLLIEPVDNPLPRSSFGSIERYVRITARDGRAQFRRAMIKISYTADDLGWVRGDWGFLGARYELHPEELGTLSRVYTGLSEVQASISPAVRRFDLGCRRPDRNDRFIDWWIALESLFGDRQGELAYKLSLRIAYFISGPNDRPTLARALRKAYDARSKVVHGEQPKEIKAYEKLTGDALRSALQTLIIGKCSLDKDKLDDAIAAGAQET